MSQHEELKRVQGLMVFLASASNGLEELLGRGAPSITFRAGRTTGRQTVVQREAAGDLLLTLDAVRDEMTALGLRWDFEPYKRQAEDQLIKEMDGKLEVKLVFRNCMVRSALFRYGHSQKLSLCYMNHGVFCGLVEQIFGAKRANLEIIHAGENACIKLLTVERAA